MKTPITIVLICLVCLDSYNLSAQNAPITTIGSVETYETTIVVPVTVTGFTNIGGCDLLINYDETIATATSVTVGPGVGYYYFVGNPSVPGQISVSYIYFQPGTQGLTLADGSVFLNITFERTAYGNSAIEFDFSYPLYCDYFDWESNGLNDIPNSTYYINGSVSFAMIDAPQVTLPVIEECEGATLIDVPVTVTDFDQIGSFNLTLQYDNLVCSYQSFSNESGFPGLDVLETSVGILEITGFTDATEGFTIENNSTLCRLEFNILGGSTALAWTDSGESCTFSGPAPDYEPRNDSPQSSFYIDGSFTELLLPGEAGSIISPSGGVVCQGESGVVFSVSSINNTDFYEWTLPEGATIESGEGTPEISVSFENNAVSGDVFVFGVNECGSGIASPSFPLIVEMVPSPAGQIAGPPGGIVCQGSSDNLFSLLPISNAVSYEWILPEGATIESGEGTHEINVSFSNNAVSGDISVYGVNECGSGIESPNFPIIVETAPLIITQPMSPDTVYANEGMAGFSVVAEGNDLSYQWQEYSLEWSDISDGGLYSGSATTILTITNPPVSMNGNHYRCIVNGNCDPPAITDGNATLNVIVFTGLDNNENDNDDLKFVTFPNPFSEKVSFNYYSPSKGTITIEIVNMYGEKVAIITRETQNKGKHIISYNTKHLKPGLYIANISFKNQKAIIRNTLKIICDM